MYKRQALCNVSKISAEKAVELIKTLDPPGIGASDLKECLSIQLKLQQPCDTVALDIVENCLELVANNQLKTIAKQLNTTLDSVLDAVKNIKSLNPYPGAGFRTNDSPNYIVPDEMCIRDRNTVIHKYFLVYLLYQKHR